MFRAGSRSCRPPFERKQKQVGEAAAGTTKAKVAQSQSPAVRPSAAAPSRRRRWPCTSGREFVGALGLLLHGDREEHRPDVGEAQPAATTPANSEHCEPVMRAIAPAGPSKAERRKQVAGSSPSARRRPEGGRRSTTERKPWGPNVLAVLLSCRSLQGGLEEPAHGRLCADVEEDAQHRQQEKRVLPASRGSSRCSAARPPWSPRPSTGTETKAQPSGHRTREMRPPAHALEKGDAWRCADEIGGGRAADALDALGEGQVAAVAPSRLTSRMIGLPATCRNVVPTPSKKMQPRETAKLGGYKDGITTATA